MINLTIENHTNIKEIIESNGTTTINTIRIMITDTQASSWIRVPKHSLTFKIIMKTSTNLINIIKIILKKATTIGTKKVGIKDTIFMNMKE
jgi:hypothetical protein